MQSKDNQLFHYFSHDIRNLLSGIIGNSSIYLERMSNLSEKEKFELVSSINTDALNMLNLYEDFISFGKMKNQIYEKEVSNESLEEIISETVFHFTYHAPDCKIEATVPQKVIFLSASSRLISHLLSNLLECSYYFSEKSAPIKLTVSDTADYLTISIYHQEQNFDSHKLYDYLNDRNHFQHLDSTTRRMVQKLQISEMMVKYMNGILSCEPDNMGTKLIIQLAYGE